MKHMKKRLINLWTPRNGSRIQVCRRHWIPCPRIDSVLAFFWKYFCCLTVNTVCGSEIYWQFLYLSNQAVSVSRISGINFHSHGKFFGNLHCNLLARVIFTCESYSFCQEMLWQRNVQQKVTKSWKNLFGKETTGGLLQ